MKFLRFGPIDREKPGVLDRQGRLRDLSALIPDLVPEALARLSGLTQELIDTLPQVSGSPRFGPCLARPGKILCLGYNSREHTREMGRTQFPEEELLVFLKAQSALSGPYDPIPYSPLFRKLDWEAELALIIGEKGKNLSPEEAGSHILGYACFNDLSERFWQFETADKQYTKGKGMDGLAPLGPYLATQDEVPDPANLPIRLWVNGELRQDFSGAAYRFGPREAVSYLSRFFTLYPGDVVALGSGPGNAGAWGEDCYLKPGDLLEMEIKGLGRQRQEIKPG